MESFADLCRIQHREFWVNPVMTDGVNGCNKVRFVFPIFGSDSISTWNMRQLGREVQQMYDELPRILFIATRYRKTGIRDTQKLFEVYENVNRFKAPLSLSEHCILSYLESAPEEGAIQQLYDWLHQYAVPKQMLSQRVCDLVTKYRNRLSTVKKLIDTFNLLTDDIYIQFVGEISLMDIFTNYRFWKVLYDHSIAIAGNATLVFYVPRVHDFTNNLCGSLFSKYLINPDPSIVVDAERGYTWYPQDDDRWATYESFMVDRRRDLAGTFTNIFHEDIEGNMWRNTYVPPNSPAKFLTPEMKLLPAYSPWVRDLTQDGDVESNPGPAMSTLKPADYRNEGLMDGIKNWFSMGHMHISHNHTFGLDAKFLGFLTFITSAYYVRHKPIALAGVVTTYLLTLGFDYHYIQQILTNIKDEAIHIIKVLYRWISRAKNDHMNDAVNQSKQEEVSDDKVTVLDAIVKFFQKLWDFKMSGKEFIEMCKNISWVARGGQSLQWIVTKLIEAVTWVYHLVVRKKEMLISDQFTEDLVKWMARTKELMSNSAKMDIADKIEAFETEMYAGQNFYACLKSHKELMRTYLGVQFYERYRLFESEFKKVSKEPAPARLKVPAYCIGLHGDPASGKSGITNRIIMSFIENDNTLTPEEKIKLFTDGGWEKIIYASNGVTKHDDGLRINTQYWVFDDFDQKNDAQEENTEFMNLIRINNPYPSFANMAELGDKGKIQLKAKAVILSSNTKQLNTHSIKHIDAFVRRLQSWWVSIKPEYRDKDGRLDTSKVDGISFDIYQFQRHDLKTGQTSNTVYSWKQFEEIIIREFKENQTKGQAFVAGMDNEANKAAERIRAQMKKTEDADLKLAEEIQQKLDSEAEDVNFDITGAEKLCKDKFDTLAVNIANQSGDKIFIGKDGRQYLIDPETKQVFVRNEIFGGVLFGASSLLASYFMPRWRSEKEMDFIKMMEKHNIADRFPECKDIFTDFKVADAIIDKRERCREIVRLSILYKEQMDKMKAEVKKNESLSQSVITEFKQAINVSPLVSMVGVLLSVVGAFSLAGVVAGVVVAYVWKAIRGIFSWVSSEKEWVRMEEFDIVKIDGVEYAMMKRDKCEQGKFSKVLYCINDFFKRKAGNLLSLKNKMCNLLCRYWDRLKKVSHHAWIKLTTKQVEAQRKDDDLETPVNQIVYDSNFTRTKAARTILEGLAEGEPEEKRQKTADGEVIENQSVNTGMSKAMAGTLAGISGNHFDVCLKVDDEWVPHMSGLFLKGSYLLVPAHLLPLLLQHETYGLRDVQGVISEHAVDKTRMKLYMMPSLYAALTDEQRRYFDSFVSLKEPNLLEKTTDFLMSGCARDAMALRVPGVQPKRDIVNYFLQRHEWPAQIETTVAFVHFGVKDEQLVLYMSKLAADERSLMLSDSMSEYMYKYWLYSGTSQPGDCGNVVVSAKTGKILGMHTMGTNETDSTKCWAVPISKEGLTLLLSDIENQQRMYVPHIPEEVKPVFHIPDSLKNFNVIGRLDTPTFQPGSKIRKSLVHGLVDTPTKAPANLLGDADVLVQGIQKYRRKIVKGHFEFGNRYIDEKFARNKVKEVFRRLARGASKPRFPYSLTLHEAIYGIPDTHIRSIPRNTSAGYGWEKGGGKKKWIAEDGSIHPDLLHVLEDCHSKAKQGLIPFMPAIATLKDELKPLAKVNSPRVFTAYTMQEVILTKQYFGGFVDWFVSNVCHNQSLVGTKATGTNIHLWVEKVLSYPNFVCMDYSKFDSDENTYLLTLIMEQIAKWYRKYGSVDLQDEIMREMLTASLMNLVILVRNYFLRLTHSLGSGHPLTAILNTIYNMLLMLLVFFIQFEVRRTNVIGFMSRALRFALEELRDFAPPEVFESADVFYDHVFGGFYGDDVFIGVSNIFKQLFGMRLIELVLKFLGHTVTTGEKEAITEDFVDVSKFEILKRVPVWNATKGQWVLALREDVIREIPNYIRKSTFSNPVEDTKTNIETALREMSLHGEKKYNFMAGQYECVCEGLGLNIVIHPYRVMARRYVTSELFGAFRF